MNLITDLKTWHYRRTNKPIKIWATYKKIEEPTWACGYFEEMEGFCNPEAPFGQEWSQEVYMDLPLDEVVRICIGFRGEIVGFDSGDGLLRGNKMVALHIEDKAKGVAFKALEDEFTRYFVQLMGEVKEMREA